MLYSRAIFRTSGDRGPATSSGAAAGTATAGAAAGVGCATAGAGTGGASGLVFSTGFGGATAATFPSPLSSIRATTVLMATVLPSSTMTSARTPADGAGISVSTLSVEISNS